MRKLIEIVAVITVVTCLISAVVLLSGKTRSDTTGAPADVQPSTF